MFSHFLSLMLASMMISTTLYACGFMALDDAISEGLIVLNCVALPPFIAECDRYDMVTIFAPYSLFEAKATSPPRTISGSTTLAA